MKKTTLIAAYLLLAAMTATAETTLKQTATKTYTGIVTADNAQLTNVMAKASDGSVYTSGVFDTAFEGLEPITGSSYIMKNDASTLTPTWKVTIQGSATVTAMVADADGGLYVGGNFADEITITGTDSNTKELKGYQESGAYTTKQNAAFFAHYDKDGKLLAANSIVPKHNDDLDATGFYLPEDGEVFCYVNDLVYMDGQLYAALSTSNTITTTDGNTSIASGDYDLWGSGWYVATKTSIIASIDKDMNVVSFPFYVKSSSLNDGNISPYSVSSSAMTGSNGHIYLALVSTGTVYETAFGHTAEAIAFVDETGANENPAGFSVIDIDVTAQTAKIVGEWPADTDTENNPAVSSVLEYGNALILTGNFSGTLAFSNSKKAVASFDLYAAKISKNGEIGWAVSSGYDNGDALHTGEYASAATVVGNKLFIGARAQNTSDWSLLKPFFFSIDIPNGTLTDEATTDYISSLYGLDSENFLMATQPSTLADVTFSVYSDPTAGISTVSADKSTVEGKIYNLNGQHISKPAKGLYIVNGQVRVAE